MLDKVEKDYGLIDYIFGGFERRYKDFVPLIKLHIYNRLTYSVSVHQINNTYPLELYRYLGFRDIPSPRTLNRTLERLGEHFGLIYPAFQRFLSREDLTDDIQVIDFTSTYFVGSKAQLGARGYSRDHRPDRDQVNIGISTGINGIPSAITIQKGNVQDKKHMKGILKVLPSVIPENSLLIFDCGANTKANKEKIRSMSYHYLTLKAKKKRVYKRYIDYFERNMDQSVHIKMNEREYFCVRQVKKGETKYIFFSPDLLKTQITQKERKLQREIDKGNKILRRRKNERHPSDHGWVELVPQLQKTIIPIDNPYITGIEGFFILESSIYEEPEKILRLYKERDQAEKFFRNLKEGIEIHPIRHWKAEGIMGVILISFLANLIINLTQVNSPKANDGHKFNVKVLKKKLMNLSLTVVYPDYGFRFTIISNITPPIEDLFGDFIEKYSDKSLKLRW